MQIGDDLGKIIAYDKAVNLLLMRIILTRIKFLFRPSTKSFYQNNGNKIFSMEFARACGGIVGRVNFCCMNNAKINSLQKVTVPIKI